MKKFIALRGAGFILTILLSILSMKSASAGECYVSVTNAAEPHDGTVFRIVTETDGFDPAVMEVTAGEGFGKTLAEGKEMSAEGVTTCSFMSVRAEEQDVPAFSEFGAIGIGILLGLVGAFIVYRRHGPRRWR